MYINRLVMNNIIINSQKLVLNPHEYPAWSSNESHVQKQQKEQSRTSAFQIFNLVDVLIERLKCL